MAKLSPEHINVLSLRAYYDQKTSTNTVEMANLLKYESQHFRCKVQLEIGECIADRCWSIGLVQACDRMYLENRYGNSGSSFWEFHPLKSGRHKMVNDSDGRQYPFYSLTSSKFEIRRGMVSDSLVSLTYEDHFYPTVAWELPYYGGAKLTDVIRKQDFWVWLVAIRRASSRASSCDVFNAKHDEVTILQTMRWRYSLHMTFDPHQPIGKRLQRIYDIQEEQPVILESNRPLPLSALSPPHCNAAQSLIWYPNNPNDKPKLLVPPKQIIVPWEMWTNDMAPGRHLSVKKPEQCKLVGEWAHDADIGIDVNQYRSYAATNNHRSQHVSTSGPPVNNHGNPGGGASSSNVAGPGGGGGGHGGGCKRSHGNNGSSSNIGGSGSASNPGGLTLTSIARESPGSRESRTGSRPRE